MKIHFHKYSINFYKYYACYISLEEIYAYFFALTFKVKIQIEGI